LLALATAVLTIASVGCYSQQMGNQERYDPLEESEQFPNRMASRPLVEETVARGHLREDTHMYEGKVDGQPATTFPVAVDAALLQRGQERYDIFCAPCHDRAGTGNGMVVQRGFQRAASLHVDRLRESAPGYFYDVITNGFGAMPNYASQVPVEDRWAIIAYVRVLQFSQHADTRLLNEEDLQRLGPPPMPAQPAAQQEGGA
jgi:mono/diheme cytochrome c family protein